MNEPSACNVFLFQRLSGDDAVTALVGDRIYPDEAPEDAEFPLIVYSLQASEDRMAVGAGARLWTRPLYNVKACTKDTGEPALAGRIASAIDQALTGAAGTLSYEEVDYRIEGTDREQPFQFHETVQGKRYDYAGGLYRLTAYVLP